MIVRLTHDPRLPKPKRHKYGAEATRVDGIRFASKGEAKRWMTLKLMERSGLIRDLERQQPFPLSVSGLVIGNYIADFTYCALRPATGWTPIIEDFKGMQTHLSEWKCRHVRAQYGIEVTITGAAKKVRKTRAA